MKLGIEEILKGCFGKDGNRDVYYPWGRGLTAYYITANEKRKIEILSSIALLLFLTLATALFIFFGLKQGGISDAIWIVLLVFNFCLIGGSLLTLAWGKRREKLQDSKSDSHVPCSYDYMRTFLTSFAIIIAISATEAPESLGFWLTVLFSLILYVPVLLYTRRYARDLRCDEKEDVTTFRWSYTSMVAYTFGMSLMFVPVIAGAMIYVEPDRPVIEVFEISSIILALYFLACVILSPLLCFTYSVRVSKSRIYGINSSGIRIVCDWSEIIEVKQKRKLFVKYLVLLDESGNNLISFPYNYFRNKGEFEKNIRKYTPSDHPLREFL